jgi:hypothetical protein
MNMTETKRRGRPPKEIMEVKQPEMTRDAHYTGIAEKIREFQDRAFAAQVAINSGEDPEQWLEVDEDVVNYFNRRGLKPGGFFTYGNPAVYVCRKGDKEKIQANLGKSMEEVLHGHSKLDSSAY